MSVSGDRGRGQSWGAQLREAGVSRGPWESGGLHVSQPWVWVGGRGRTQGILNYEARLPPMTAPLKLSCLFPGGGGVGVGWRWDGGGGGRRLGGGGWDGQCSKDKGEKRIYSAKLTPCSSSG